MMTSTQCFFHIDFVSSAFQSCSSYKVCLMSIKHSVFFVLPSFSIVFF